MPARQTPPPPYPADGVDQPITAAPDDGLNIPVPDPSLMTTRQLQREIFNLRELLETKLGSGSASNDLIRTVIETRLDGMDKAIKLLQDSADKFPARIDEKITSLREVHEQKFAALSDTHGERFSSIQTQFKERDVRAEQTSKDSKVAVDAALQAAKEAVGEQNKSSALAIAKSEASTVKQIDQQAVLITAMSKSFDDKIDDLKERLTRAEGKGTGLNQGWGYLVAAIGVIGVLVAIFAASSERTAPVIPPPQVIYVPAPAGSLLPTTPPQPTPR